MSSERYRVAQAVDLVGTITELFVHRRDAYAEQYVNKTTGESGYVKAQWQTCKPRCPNRNCKHTQLKTLTDLRILEHLNGERTIGVYQLGADDTVKWVCFDVDKDKTLAESIDKEQLAANAKEQVRSIVDACLDYGIRPLVENSAGRGFHVWVLFDQPVPANLAQALATGIMQDVEEFPGLNVEVFPKQVSVSSFGNLVKLPLGINQKSGQVSHFVGRDFRPIRDQGLYLATAKLVTPEDAKLLVDALNVPVVSIRRDNPNMDSEYGKYTPRCLVKGLREGVGDGLRDSFSFRLACYLRDRGIPEELAQSMLGEWNEKNSPPLAPSTLATKVRSAFTQNYGYLPCQDKSFDRMCDSGCDFYKFKAAKRSDLVAKV